MLRPQPTGFYMIQPSLFFCLVSCPNVDFLCTHLTPYTMFLFLQPILLFFFQPQELICICLEMCSMNLRRAGLAVTRVPFKHRLLADVLPRTTPVKAAQVFTSISAIYCQVLCSSAQNPVELSQVFRASLSAASSWHLWSVESLLRGRSQMAFLTSLSLEKETIERPQSTHRTPLSIRASQV